MQSKPPVNRETKLVYITLYALSSSVSLRTAEVSKYGLWVPKLYKYFQLGKDAFESKSDAIANVEVRRKKKIEGLKKQIEKLEKLQIKVTDDD